ncbi:MAG: DUF2911 domain-containing protein [Blastocatellia bacterium]|nr:DUF2911 domain-containing protein [Blastocatellia bacterium]
MQQDKMQTKASPRKSAEMTLNGKKISVDYGAPSVRGRKIFGELVPYNQVWRLGANEATHFKTEADLKVGDATVPKGTYTLWVWPTESGWKLIINKSTGVWGTPYKYEETELARVDMKLEKTKAPVEQMVLALNNAGEGGMIKMEWENTRASVHFAEKK